MQEMAEESPSHSALDDSVGAMCARVSKPLRTSTDSVLQAWILRKQHLCGVADAFLAGLSVAAASSSATRQGHHVGDARSTDNDSELRTGGTVGGRKSWSGLARALFFFATLFAEPKSPPPPSRAEGN